MNLNVLIWVLLSELITLAAAGPAVAAAAAALHMVGHLTVLCVLEI